MNARWLAFPFGAALLAGALADGAARASEQARDEYDPGVFDPQQARTDYQLKCQGCHRPDGSGDLRSNPPMHGVVARFLSVPGGREFIGRVPGVATVDLPDDRLANLVNWTIFRFDRAHVPAGFRPYTASEIGRLRQKPLRLERAATRTQLVAGFAKTAPE